VTTITTATDGDYWEDEWATVEKDFHEMRRPGANVVRVHL